MTRQDRNEVFRGLMAHRPPAESARLNRICVYAVAIGEALDFRDRALVALRCAVLIRDWPADRDLPDYQFVRDARQILTRPTQRERQVIETASSFVDSDNPDEFLEDAGFSERGDPEVVTALRRVHRVIQPIGEP